MTSYLDYPIEKPGSRGSRGFYRPCLPETLFSPVMHFGSAVMFILNMIGRVCMAGETARSLLRLSRRLLTSDCGNCDKQCAFEGPVKPSKCYCIGCTKCYANIRRQASGAEAMLLCKDYNPRCVVIVVRNGWWLSWLLGQQRRCGWRSRSGGACARVEERGR
jgi:hypothetical protein